MAPLTHQQDACDGAAPLEPHDPGDEAALYQRRAMVLRVVAARLIGALDEDDVARRASKALQAFTPELPFLLHYHCESAGSDFRLLAAHGLKPGAFMAPTRHGAAHAPWPLQEAVSERRRIVVEVPSAWLDGQAIWPGGQAPGAVVVKPICMTMVEAVRAVVVIGVPCGMPLDEAHCLFHDDLCALIGEALLTAQARSEERRRIARDLHDTLGQHLAALQMALNTLKAQGVQGLGRIEAMAETVDRDLDRIILGLRPNTVGHEGLCKAIEAFIASWQRLFDRPVDMLLRLQTGELPGDVEAAVLSVIQEALTNVARHSHAEHVSIVVEQGQHELWCAIEDDGVGFDEEQSDDPAPARRHWGLVGMKERIEFLGGSLQIESGHNKGTTVLFRIPCSATQAERLQSDNAPGRSLREEM